MSYILTLIRQAQIRTINRSVRLMGNKVFETSQSFQPATRPLTTSAPILGPNQNEKKNLDDVKYVIKLKKGMTYGDLFKDTYKIYGPIFIATHIGISLTSLGFWYSLVWLTVDPTQYIPDAWLAGISSSSISLTGEGGKFVLAYAIHKITLPIRLAGSIWLTRILSKIVKSKRKDVDST